MSLYKYVKFEDLKRILDGSIRFTQPGAFNDPFEMVPELYVPEGSGIEEIAIQFSVTAPRREPVIGALEDDFASDYCSDQNSLEAFWLRSIKQLAFCACPRMVRPY